MIQVLTVVHECTDFDRWKAAYDADAPRRKAAGLTQRVMSRNVEQPNVIAIVFEMADRAKAQAMVGSAELRDVMQKAGIIGKPDIHFRQGEFTGGTGTVLTVNCRISSIDTFRKGFAMDKADRQAAELTDIALLQDMDDPADLLLIFRMGDPAKARAFITSPSLAEHQVKNAGILGPPRVRYWKVV